jgi:hypothetical protein
MKAVLLKTYLALNQKPPGENGLLTRALVVGEDLDDIPTEELDYCFRQARLSRSDSFFPSTGEVMTVWGHRSAEIVRLRENKEGEVKQLSEPAPEGIGTDCDDYVANPTPEKLKRLQDKYPNAGF